MKEFTAACVQIAVTPNDVQANVDKGISWLEKAVSEYEAELVVFPETVTTSFVTGLGSIGMIVCYDGDFPELSRLLAVKGAEVIVRPAALLRSFDIWHITNAARAYDNHVYVIATNAVGPDAGGNYYLGHSMIVNPIAWRLAQARCAT